MSNCSLISFLRSTFCCCCKKKTLPPRETHNITEVKVNTVSMAEILRARIAAQDERKDPIDVIDPVRRNRFMSTEIVSIITVLKE